MEHKKQSVVVAITISHEIANTFYEWKETTQSTYS